MFRFSKFLEDGDQKKSESMETPQPRVARVPEPQPIPKPAEPYQWTIEDTIQFAYQTLEEHGFGKHWTVEIDNNKRRLGVCKYWQRTLSFSRYMIEGSTAEEVKGIVLHEVAHAINSREGGRGHDAGFKRIARGLGAPDKSFANVFSVKKPPQKYTAHCPNCGDVGGRTRRPKGKFKCNKCGEFVTFTQNY